MIIYSFRCFLICTYCALVKGYASFRDDIPNGYNVPNPCGQGELWQGVGHLVPGGGGERNQFGIDFARNGQLWQNVCRLDSDGDGKTNGEELGDPNCVWSKGTVPMQTTGLSHPGFCDPLGGSECINNQNKPHCEKLSFDCPAINDPVVQSRVLKFPTTAVPNKETNYFCMTFDLDESQDYHLIANKPEIDNENVMHHIILYGCKDGAENISTPRSCGMSSANCDDAIGLWSVGITGECMYQEAGFRIGKTGFKRVLMEFHWNNPELRRDYMDGSGMTIYYTPNLRQYDAGVFWTGETELIIPPRRQRVVFDSTCSSECTSRIFKETIYFTQGLNHMHYRGVSQYVRKTSGGVESHLTNEPNFNYDTPKKFIYDPPMPVHPGDSLKTTCVFQSMKDNKTTFFGVGTDDEMCFGIFTYYPKEAVTIDRCITSGTFDHCKLQGGYYEGCNLGNFLNRGHPDTKMLMEKVLDKCNAFGGCRQECPAAIAEAEQHPCLQPENKEWALRFTSNAPELLAVKFAAAMKSCSCINEGHTPEPYWPSTGSSGTGVTVYSLLSTSILVFLAA